MAGPWAGAPEPGGPAFDLTDPRWMGDPYPLYRDLREQDPVHRTELGFWVLSRHADCLALLRDPRASSNAQNADPTRLRRTPRVGLTGQAQGPEAAAVVQLRPFLFRDPPDHTRLRGLVSQAFTPRMVESLRARTQAVVDELLARALDAGQVDLVEAFAYPLPVTIICDLLGIPAEDQHRFRAWSSTLARGLDPDFLLPEEALDERREAVTQFAQYFFPLLAERRRSPGDDLLSMLAAVEDGGATLSEPEMLVTCILLLVAGHETTVNLIAGGALALLRHPDQLERFRTDPSVLRSGVEEMLRYVSPVQLTARSLLADVEVGDVRLRKGDFVMLLLASANRDPDQFAEPERFDVGRTPNNHLGFGFGIHHCLGAPLARMEAQVALSSLVRQAPDLALVGDDSTITYRSTVVLRGMEALPVSLRG